MAKDKKSGLLGRREERICRRAAAALLKYAGGMKGASWAVPDEAWEWIRRQFMAESDAYESMKESCGRKLEHAFDFMEASFGGGQEMVIFITELNAGEACVEFLNDYHCERYFHYNKELLFDQREMDIRNRLRPV